MTRYLVTLRYRTPAGNPGGWTVPVAAADPEQATRIAARRLARRASGADYRVLAGDVVPADRDPAQRPLNGPF